MVKPQSDLVGKTLGQYEIMDEIGRGGMATVYRARQPSINRVVALKVLPPHFLHDPDFFERFKREVDVIAHLEHPHILPIYDYGEAEGIPFIAMRFLAGGSMAQMLRRGIPRLDALERPLSQVSEALDHAHMQGIIHRDLKPGNILLDEHNNAYLGDFGIARVLNSSLTGSSIIGTPAYMSPEQANGLPLDARSDIYALGVVLFELITGREPYEAQTPMALMLKHINEPMPSVRAIRPDVPPAVEDVINIATAKDPNERYASARDMAEDYRAALYTAMLDNSPTLPPDAVAPLRHTPSPMTPPRSRKPTGMASSVANTPPPTSPPMYQTQPLPVPARKRSPAVYGAAAVIAIAILLGLGAVFVLPGILRTGPVPVPTVTPFPGARLISTNEYTVAIPDSWSPTDFSSEARKMVVWQAASGNANVAVAVMQADVDNFDQTVQLYDRTYYNNPGRNQTVTLIDESTAPDGSLRRSYRISANNDTGFEPGQVDIFYMPRAPYLVVVETYSADSTGDTFVPVFQLILDSLHVNPASSLG
jgi:serine/threonine protein kinase